MMIQTLPASHAPRWRACKCEICCCYSPTVVSFIVEQALIYFCGGFADLLLWKFRTWSKIISIPNLFITFYNWKSRKLLFLFTPNTRKSNIICFLGLNMTKLQMQIEGCYPFTTIPKIWLLGMEMTYIFIIWACLV